MRTLVCKGFVRLSSCNGTLVLLKDNWNLLDPDVMVWTLTRTRRVLN